MAHDVLVTGAGGRTGRLVFEKLSANPAVSARGLVRSISRAAEAEIATEHLTEGDILDTSLLRTVLNGMKTLVILTSAVPRMMTPPADGKPGVVSYDPEGMPELVDWEGARNQIEIAKDLGVEHVILVGSMGGTEENNPLNRIGNGNILRYKRKAQMHLIESGVPYTVINPGLLLNEPDSERELVVGRNDELFTVFDRMKCGVPRGDVARVVEAAVLDVNARNKAFDLVAVPKGDGVVTEDLSKLFLSAGPDL